MGTIGVRLSGGQDITAAITLDAIDDLKLTDGLDATVLLKSTEVSVAIGQVPQLSIRNRIPATIFEVEPGAVMTIIRATIAGGDTITAAITKDGADDLELAPGDPVTMLIEIHRRRHRRRVNASIKAPRDRICERYWHRVVANACWMA